MPIGFTLMQPIWLAQQNTRCFGRQALLLVASAQIVCDLLTLQYGETQTDSKRDISRSLALAKITKPPVDVPRGGVLCAETAEARRFE